ncbi:MAG TPA: hypothetical protein VGJ81_02705 [Thermoanaerobaculia bacterium]
MRIPKTLGLLGLAFIACIASAAQPSDDDVVANAFPPGLTLGKGVHGKWWTFATADLNHSGQPLLVALYTNGSRAALEVVSRSGSVLAGSQVNGMKGTTGEIELADLDHDGTPEILAHLYAGHGVNRPDTWVFAWRNGALTLVSPMQVVRGNAITLLGQTAAVDLAGDGTRQLLAFPGAVFDADGNDISGDTIVYSYSNGALQKASGTYVYADDFRRSTAKPEVSSGAFTSAVGVSTLHVVQNDTPVTSGRITLNGTEVVAADAFKAKAHAFTVPITLAAHNTLSVQLEGQPGASVLVMIETPRASQ